MMPDNQTDTNTTAKPAVDAPAEQGVSDAGAMMNEVANKVAEAHNILVALSSDPTVDEMCAAIGLSLALDRVGKRATAIYSGNTPNALEFLRPQDTFDTSADTLQDFVIALSKDKADHLRYKLDGDYVKIYITPYKARISEEDLEFSYGDYNIDLVLALNVSNGADLDSALREHGRIMHDATIINVTTGNPGKFGDIQWSDKSASSLCEMAARLLLEVDKTAIDKEEATAFLTGIVAATNRFSKPNTTAETMDVASKLMVAGADQQLISQNITSEINNEVFGLGSLDQRPVRPKDETALEIEHEAEKTEAVEEKPEPEGGALLDDLKAAEENLAKASAEAENVAQAQEPAETNGQIESQAVDMNGAPAMPEMEVKPEKVIAPSANFSAEPSVSEKYGQMVEKALADAGGTNDNLAAVAAPTVTSEPEINGVPEINYMPMPGDAVLPPPPTPPIDMSRAGMMPPAEVVAPTANVSPIRPATPTPETAPESLGPQPAMQDQVYNEMANDPGAFKIPGA